MKILQLIDSLSAGGAERMAVNMANAFAKKGIANVLCATRSGGPLENCLDKKVPYYLLHKKSIVDLFAFLRLLRIILRYKPDVLHAHSSSYLWAICAKLFYPKMAVVWHDHYGLSETLQPKDRMWLRKFSSGINGIVVVNEVLKKWNIKNTAVPESRIRLIRNFPDPNGFERKGRAGQEIAIVCLANFKPEKDHLTLIHAFHIAVNELPDRKLSLWLAGSPVGKNGEKITRLVNELNLNERVVFLGPVRDTAALLAKADIGVLASYSEGLPVSLLEYGLAGLPVLVTDVGQCGEVVQNGLCGWVVSPQDVEAFARALVHILSHPAQAREKGELLRQRIMDWYGSDRFVTEYSSFLHSLLSRSLPVQSF